MGLGLTAIVYALGILILGISIAAGIIMLSTRIVAGFKPKFLLAAATALIAWIATGIGKWVLNITVGPGTASSVLAFVILFLVSAAIFNAMLKQPDGGQMGFGKACLATLVYIVIALVVAVILFFALGATIMGLIGVAAMH